MGVERYLPNNEYLAAVNANAPTAGNPFATIADLAGIGNNWANSNLVLSGNRVHDFDSNTLTENNVAEYDTNVQGPGNRKISWDNGAGVTIIGGVGANPAAFTGSGASTYFMNTPLGTKAWGGIWNNGGNAQMTYSIYDPAFSTDEAGYIAQSSVAGGNFTQASIYHLEYSSGDQTGFTANIFGERLLSQSLSLTRLSAVDASAGFAFVSGAGGTGYIRPADQDGFTDWMDNYFTTNGWGGIYHSNGIITDTNRVVDYVTSVRFQVGGGTNYTRINVQYLEQFSSTATVATVSANRNGTAIAIAGGSNSLTQLNSTDSIQIFTQWNGNPTNSGGGYVGSFRSDGKFEVGFPSPTTATPALVSFRGTGTGSGTYAFGVQNDLGQFGFYVRDDGLILMGTITQSNVLGVPNTVFGSRTITDSVSNNVNYSYDTTYNPDANNIRSNGSFATRINKIGANNTREIAGIGGQARNSGTGQVDRIYGTTGFSWNTGNATVLEMFAGSFNCQMQDGTITDFGSIKAELQQYTNGTITNMYHFLAETPANVGATVTNFYSVYLEASAPATNNFGIYQAGASQTNIFNGNMAIGATSVVNSQLEVTGDVEVIGATNGLILESPDNTRWQVKIDNAGSLTFVSLP
jgi:hypothetical protein